MRKIITFLFIIVGFCCCFSKGISIGKIIEKPNIDQSVEVREQVVVDQEIIKLLENIYSEKDISGTVFECSSSEELEAEIMEYVYKMSESEGTVLWLK